MGILLLAPLEKCTSVHRKSYRRGEEFRFVGRIAWFNTLQDSKVNLCIDAISTRGME